MEKRQARTLAVIIFGVLLAFAAARSSSRGRGELGELQIAMWNLNRVDNLQMSYAYGWQQNGTTGEEAMNVWADMLTGSWASEHYTTDEDGTRLYLRQFCDGKSIYHYIDWSGDWEQIQAPGQGGTAVPNLAWMTELGFDGDDIYELKRKDEDGTVELTCVFTPEYLDNVQAGQLAQVEQSYAYYEKSGADVSAIHTAALSVEQHKQMRYEDMTVTYTIDENQVLREMEYTIRLVMPEIVQDLSGNKMLGQEREMQITLDMEIERYNQSGITNKIEQCSNEMMY